MLRGSTSQKSIDLFLFALEDSPSETETILDSGINEDIFTNVHSTCTDPYESILIPLETSCRSCKSPSKSKFINFTIITCVIEIIRSVCRNTRDGRDKSPLIVATNHQMLRSTSNELSVERGEAGCSVITYVCARWMQ